MKQRSPERDLLGVRGCRRFRDAHRQEPFQHLGVDLLAGQVPVHEALVLALGDDALDQLAAQVGHALLVGGRGRTLGALATGVAVQLLRQQPDQAGDGLADRQVQRRHGVAEGLAARVQRRLELGPLMVDLGDHDRARHADRGALVPQHPGHAVDPVGCGYSEQR